MVTAEQAAEFLGVPADTDVSSLLSTATALIDREIGDADVPADVLDNATLQLCSELWLRRNNPGGIVNFANGDGVARVTRDPMTSVRPLLIRWVVPF